MFVFLKRHRFVLTGIVITAGYFAIFVFLHSPPNPYCSVIDFVESAPSNEVGDFFAGFFAPVAFLWLVIGYFMQANELRLQRKELEFQREELQATRATMESQVSQLEEQTNIEASKVRPYFTLERTGQSQGRAKFKLKNTGADAYDLQITCNNEKRRAPQHAERNRAISLSEPADQGAEYVWLVEYEDSRGSSWSQVFGLHPDDGLWADAPEKK